MAANSKFKRCGVETITNKSKAAYCRIERPNGRNPSLINADECVRRISDETFRGVTLMGLSLADFENVFRRGFGAYVTDQAVYLIWPD